MSDECDFYDQPGQTCMTAGMAVVAAEGLCGPCALRVLGQPKHAARPPHPNTMAGRK